MDVVQEKILDLREQGHRQIVFSQFKTALAEFGSDCLTSRVKVVRFDGDTKDAAREQIRHDFRLKDGDAEVVLVHYRAGGSGLNLQGATVTHILDEEWSAGKRNQGYARNHRIGQESVDRCLRVPDAIDRRHVHGEPDPLQGKDDAGPAPHDEQREHDRDTQGRDDEGRPLMGPQRIDCGEYCERKTKCPASPTKRQYLDTKEAWKAAGLRSQETGLDIVAYACPDCGYFHLTKKVKGSDVVVNADVGITTGALRKKMENRGMTFTPPKRVEVPNETPIKPGNPEAEAEDHRRVRGNARSATTRELKAC